jgi:hypothetical protein
VFCADSGDGKLTVLNTHRQGRLEKDVQKIEQEIENDVKQLIKK